jgi:flagellar basal-body rod modification protein FlgD
MSVVGSKLGTKAWSDAPQNEIARPPAMNNNSAKDLEKLGGDSVGDVLNKVADPNYIDPAKKLRTSGNDKLDKDAFMKLMLAQMKNQDPTNPLKSHEMAAQLAQFSGLEQMQNVNTTLTEMLKAQKPNEGFQALNFIGKAVAGDSAKVTRLKGDKDHEFNFTLPADAKDIEIKVKSADGDLVRKIDLHDMKQGDQRYVWNGKTESGSTAPVGEYQFSIEAKSSNGSKLFVKTDFSGVISGISYTKDGPLLMVGSQSVKLKDVKKIIDPALDSGLKSNDQNIQKMMMPDLQKVGAAAETEDKGAEEVLPKGGNIASNVGMTGEMLEKFKQETKADAPADVKAAVTPKGPVKKPETKVEHKTSEPTKEEKAMVGKKSKTHGA